MVVAFAVFPMIPARYVLLVLLLVLMVALSLEGVAGLIT